MTVNKFRKVIKGEVPNLSGFSFVFTPTKRQFKHVCRIMRKSGLTWSDSTSLTNYGPYDKFRDKTCIDVHNQTVESVENVDKYITPQFFLDCVYQKMLADNLIDLKKK